MLIRTNAGIVDDTRPGTAPAWLFKLLDRPLLGRTMKIGPEDRLAIEFADWCRAASLTGELFGLWSHLPHEVGGGTKNAGLRYALCKAMGLIAGSGDYVFTRPGGCLWLEAKKPKTETRAGALNPDQKLFKQWAERENVPYHVFTSVFEAKGYLAQHGFLGVRRDG